MKAEMFDPVNNDRHLFLLIGGGVFIFSVGIGLLTYSLSALLMALILLPVGAYAGARSYEYFLRSNTDDSDMFDSLSFIATGTTVLGMAAGIVAILSCFVSFGLLMLVDYYLFGSYFFRF